MMTAIYYLSHMMMDLGLRALSRTDDMQAVVCMSKADLENCGVRPGHLARLLPDIAAAKKTMDGTAAASDASADSSDADSDTAEAAAIAVLKAAAALADAPAIADEARGLSCGLCDLRGV